MRYAPTWDVCGIQFIFYLLGRLWSDVLFLLLHNELNKLAMKHKLIFLIACLGYALSGMAGVMELDVTRHGAVGDGKTLNTGSLQGAIDGLHARGGGVLRFPAGRYLTGSLRLKSGVTLYLEEGAVLLGSTSPYDYPKFSTEKELKVNNDHFDQALIYADGAENIGITGGGCVDGQGRELALTIDSLHHTGELVDPHYNTYRKRPNTRPKLLFVRGCRNVRIYRASFRSSAAWGLSFSLCTDVTLDSLHIENRAYWNNDGIDIDAKNVVITNSIIDCDDDAICFKSHVRDYVVENVAVSNCVISSNCSFIKFGTATFGGFKNIAITNCVMKKCTASKLRKWDGFLSKFGVTDPITGIGGISLEAVDGGFADQIVFSNLVMTDVQTPIFIRVGHRNKDEQKSYIKNVIISNVTATSASWITNSITCVDGHILKNITLRDCYFNLKACTDERLAQKSFETEVPEQVANYPENRMFNTLLPAYGFFLRRVDNITMDNVQMSYFGGNELRPVIFGEKISGMRLMNCIWQKPSGETEAINLKDSEKPYMFNCKEVKTSFLQ